MNNDEIKTARKAILEAQLIVLENNYLLQKDRLQKQIEAIDTSSTVP